MGCLKLDYYEDLQVRTCVPMLSGEAKVVQLWLSIDPDVLDIYFKNGKVFKVEQHQT